MNLTSVDGQGHVYLYATDTFGVGGDVQLVMESVKRTNL